MIGRYVYWTTLFLLTQASNGPRTRMPLERKISFLTAKPVLGLPSGVADSGGRCASDGLTFFDTATSASASPDIYTVTTTAEVKHLRRKLPSGYTDVTVRNFFPAQHTLVTLLEAENRDEGRSTRVVTDYFLSTSDRDGDEADLLSLNLHFKPLRIAAFPSGDYLVLGWDMANQLPLLAVLKPDGTARRFQDTADLGGGTASAADTLGELSKVVFVPWGEDVLLTFPGTTHAARVVHAVGPDLVIALPFPPGFVLHDVLASEGRSPAVYRVESLPAKDADGTTKPQLRLLELRPKPPSPYTELLLDNVPVGAVTCAARRSLTAVFPEIHMTPGKDGGDPVNTPTGQWMIGSVYR